MSIRRPDPPTCCAALSITPARRLHELLPWNWHAPAIAHTVAV
jgi:hypothetical protein